MADGDAVVQISEYSNAVKRWWMVIAVATAVGLVLGALFLTFKGSAYESEAQVEARPLVLSGDDPNLDAGRLVNPDTEQAIANSQRVTERALTLLAAASEQAPGDPLSVDLDDPAIKQRASELVADEDTARKISQEQIEVTYQTGSQILVFTAKSGKPSRAQELAQATAHAYLDFRGDEGLAATNQAREQLVQREAELLDELDDLAAEIGAAGDNATRVRALQYREISRSQELEGIGAKMANIDSISVNPGEVLNDANLPTSATGIPGIAGPVLGALLGFLVGLGLTFLLDRKDDRVRSSATEIGAMGLQVLGTVPVGGGLFRRGSGSAIARINSPAGEAYRRTQGSLLFNLDQLDKSMVLVAGTNNPHSSTTVAANLAVAAARSGRRTLLVGADLRRPSLHERFGLPNDAGLSDVLAGTVPINEAIQASDDYANLQILTAGTQVSEPSRLLQGDAFGRLVSSARGQFDLVVFEAPPVLQVADAVDLARLCEGAVLVIEPNRATRAGVADSVEQLRLVGADVVGTVVASTSDA